MFIIKTSTLSGTKHKVVAAQDLNAAVAKIEADHADVAYGVTVMRLA